MIKINLVAPLVANTGVSAAAGADGAVPILDDQTTQRQGGVRLAIILVGPVALYILQNVVILPDKTQNLANHNKQLMELQDKNSRASSAVTEIKQFQQDQTKLQMQIGTIESLRKDRMREVRMLELIQRQMPERMWIAKIEVRQTMSNSQDNTKDVAFNMTGYASNDGDITQFMDILGKSTLLLSVNLMNTSEKIIDGHVVKEFTLNCLFPKPQMPTVPADKSGSSGKGAFLITPAGKGEAS